MNIINNIFKNYKKISEPVKVSLWFTISNILKEGMALLATPIFTRILIQQQYGMYVQYKR